MEANNTSHLQQTNRQLTIAFLLAYVIGAALIAVNPFAPCISLAGYAALGLFLTRDQRNSDRFADSLYYLGFLLTLTALLLALWHLSKQRSSLEIANALGAGLSASILGLGLRVLVVQFRGTVSDQEEETRQSIEEQAAKVGQALVTLEAGWMEATGVLKSLREDMEEFRESMNRIQADTLRTAQQRQTQLLQSSAKAAETWNQEIQKLRDSFARLDVPPTLVRDALAGVAEDLGRTAAQVTAAAATVMEGVTARFAALGETTGKCGAALEKLIASVTTAASASDEVKKTAEGISVSVRAAGESLGLALTNGATNLGRSATAIDQHVSAAGNSVTGFTHSLQGAVQALSTIMPTMQRLESSLAAAATAIDGLEGDIQSSTSALVTEVKQVGTDLKQVREATGELVELARTQVAASS